MSELHPYVLLDVFTDAPLQGNQLAVFTDAQDISAQRMQQLARELNLSETVFLLPGAHGADARVRIFTPLVELPFAGHPVLGAAIVLAAQLGRAAVTLETGEGPVPVTLSGGGDDAPAGSMSQPIPSWSPFERRRELLGALGVDGSSLPIEVYNNGPRHVLVSLADETAVSELAPDMRSLAELGELLVSCFAGAGSQWKTRMFAPGLGVPEDPATGSAAGPLAVHLARHARIDFGQEIEIRQGAEISRPSLLRARADGSAGRIERVQVGGSARIVARGQFALDPER